MASNFEFLKNYWPELAQLGDIAEVYLHVDANACIEVTSLMAEYAAQQICAYEKLNLPQYATQADRLRALRNAKLLPQKIDDLFYVIRKAGNDALHLGIDSPEKAASVLRLTFYLCCWLMRVYGDWECNPPVYEEPVPTPDNPALVELKQIQQKKIVHAMEALCASKTPASEASPKERAQISEQVAEELPVTAEQTSVDAEPIRLDVTMLPIINYAMQQNGAEAIRSITIENKSDTVYENVELCITAIPAFALPFRRHIDRLPANKPITLTRPKLITDGEFLAGTTEKVSGVLHLELKSEGKTVADEYAETTVLAFDEWHGMGVYPEMICAFVTPNHPEVAKIIARATEFLGKWTGDTSMDGYQSQDPNRVLSQAAAIFTAIKEQAIAYVVPPASFERNGQRVRLCDTVLQQKLGTCLDLTLLYASCLESVGLHPLLITTPGHIFSGVWLEDRMFPESVQDDVSLITKRLASGVNEIAVVETTCVTTGADRSFDDARAAGEQNLSNQRLEYIIDVHRARMSHIIPLPQRIRTDGGWEIHHDATFRKDTMSAPTMLDATVEIDPNAADENLPKKVQWERKLLDLGMRNTLINLRITKTQIPILVNSLDGLENALADGSDFSILPKPADCHPDGASFKAISELGDSEIVRAEFDNKRLRSIYTEGELNKAIKGLYRTEKAALEENGANTLYLALGMLQWFESKRSTKARYAPIILVPIEMVRKSASQGYVIRMRDDDPQMNVTMLEKLKQDFGIVIKGLDPLPTDEHGVDIRKVLTILRKAVMNQPHWDVLEAASIGIFTFSQFVMWNDIRNRTDDLMRNKVVRSLIDGKLCWSAQPLEIGEQVSEDDVLLPMPADASQLYAIQAACNGESFVLHGPPGTGKSQTITSLIANALAKGKSVLFVAEKMAALEVVQKRLESIGLGPFCLELHSNKAKKRAVLEQLRKASEVTKTRSAQEYAMKAEQIAALRAELDAYAKQLHKPLACGSNLYTLINEYEYYKDAPEIEAFSRDFIQTMTKPTLEQHQLVVERMIAAAKEIGHPHGHALVRVGCQTYTQSLRGSLKSTLDAFSLQAEHILPHVTLLTHALNQPLPASFAEVERLHQIAQSMLCWYDMPASWRKTDAPAPYFAKIKELCLHASNANTLEQQLLQSFHDAFLSQDGTQLFTEYTQTDAKWALPKLLGMNKLAKTVGAFAKKPITKEHLRAHILALYNYQKESATAKELLVSCRQDLESLYCEKATDWTKIAKLADLALQSANTLQTLCGDYSVIQNHCGNPDLRTAIEGLIAVFPHFQSTITAVDDLLHITDQREENWIEARCALGKLILDHSEQLKEWIAYVGAAAEAKALGLSNLVECYAAGMAHEEVYRCYKKALLQGLIADAIDESGTLNQFSGAVFNKQIEQYKQMDREWTKLSQKEAYCRLASKVPDFTREAANSSELGILQRYIKSGGRGVSIRKMLDQIPNLLPRLCPCMLMSPISAAQYLDPKREPFDIVVFDEASQLPTCKAVGVLARGKDAIIVGDPKQMPPTAFFATNTVDEDNLEIEDLESILDDCLALNMPQSHLLWHYRSRHESLIAFSNNQFYDNKLFTFPSVNDRESKVRFVYVDGTFDRGKTRTNKAEAQAVVEEIKRRFQTPTLSAQSIGIVTFNISQQNLIDDLLNEACKQDPALEKWVYGSEEPLFVKNLENVQGDERDVILFSIGFGPDESGKIFMNFGPLNRDGGWRRLNVAVSRARCEMTVFSSMHADQLDLNRTQAEGVAALRSFLKYAEDSTLPADEVAEQTSTVEVNGIAAAIAKGLSDAGYQTQLLVGRSEYRIDVGVIDPETPDQYLLGIILDGNGYGSAKTTRDREIAQIGVLNGLGWSILRIWCMDWWDNSQKELAKILSKLQDIQDERRARREREAQEAQAQLISDGNAEEPADLPTDKDVQPQETTPKEEAEEEPVSEEEPKLLAGNTPLPQAEEKGDESLLATSEADPVSDELCAVSTAPAAPPLYKSAKLANITLSPDEFVDEQYERVIRKKIEQVIKVEAPISLSLLTKRVLQSYNISRAGSRIQGRMQAILSKMDLQTTTHEDVVFYWKPEQDTANYPSFRRNGDGDNRREIRDIPPQEAVNAVCTVLFEQIGMGQEDLIREAAGKLGFTRLGGNVVSILTAGIDIAKEKGYITLGSNGACILTEDGTARAEAVLQSFLNT